MQSWAEFRWVMTIGAHLSVICMFSALAGTVVLGACRLLRLEKIARPATVTVGLVTFAGVFVADLVWTIRRGELWVGSLPVAYSGKGESESVRLFQAGERLVQHDLEGAINAYLAAIGEDPGLERAYVALGDAYASISQTSLALEAYGAALIRSPENRRALLGIAECREQEFEYELARAAYKEYLLLEPNDASVHLRLGETYHGDRGPCEEAVQAYQQAIRLDPSNTMAHYQLGFTLALLHRPAEALLAYQQLVDIAPESSSAHLQIGRIHAGQGRHDEAVEAFARAHPDDGQPAFEMAQSLVVLGREKEATLAVLRAIQAASQHPTLMGTPGEAPPDWYALLIQLHRMMGEGVAAQEVIEDLERRDPQLARRVISLVDE